MEVLRTPDERFANLPGYGLTPHYVTVDGLRVHYVDEGPRGAAPVLLLHSEPPWSCLYQKIIPIISARDRRSRRVPGRLGRIGKGGAAQRLYLSAPCRLDVRRHRAPRPARDHAGVSGLGRSHRPSAGGRTPRAARCPL